VLSILHGVAIHLGLDVGLDLVVGGGDEDVGSGAGFFHGGHLVSFRAGLQGVYGVDHGDNDTRAEAFQRLGAFFNIAITRNNGDLFSQHDIGGTLDSIDKGLPASVHVIELGFGEGIVDIDGGDLEFVGFEHLVEVVNTNGGPLAKSLDAGKKFGVLLENKIGAHGPRCIVSRFYRHYLDNVGDLVLLMEWETVGDGDESNSDLVVDVDAEMDLVQVSTNLSGVSELETQRRQSSSPMNSTCEFESSGSISVDWVNQRYD